MNRNRLLFRHEIIALILLAVFLFLPSNSLALDPRREIDQYSLSTWSIENGLPQSSVLSVLQSKDGYIWAGTYEGLARFDGIKFDIFDKTNTPEIKTNGVNTIFLDRKEILWIGTSDGLISYSKGYFRRYSTEDGLFNNYISAIFEDQKGILWVGTTGGLNWLDQERFQGFKSEDGLSHNYISSIVDDMNGNLWIGTNGGGLNRFIDGQFIQYTEKGGFPGREVWSLCRKRDGGIWAATSNGLVLMRNDRMKIFSKKDGLSNNDIRALFEDSHGVLWLGTMDGDLNRLHNGVFSAIALKTVIHDKICSIYEDREGSLWIGTYKNGIAQLKDDKFILYNSRHGLPVDLVRSVYEDADGNLWIGTVGGGLVRFSNGRFFTYGLQHGLKNNRIWSICQGLDKSIWFGTYGGGLHRLKNGKIEVISTSNGLANDVVRVVFADSKGRIWVGTNGGGIDVIQGKKITNYSTKNGLIDDFIYAINEDREGTIWIGTFDGWIGRFKNGKFHFFSRQELKVTSAVWAIYPDPEGAVWFGTNDGGLLCFRNNRFSHFTAKDGLYSDLAFQILEDQNGSLWMNSNNGIYAVKKSDLTRFETGKIKRIPCIAFGRSEGIKYTEGSGPAQPAGCMYGKGKLCFPTTSGVVLIEPEHIPVNRISPPVEIERIVIEGKGYPPKPFIHLSAGKKNLEIQYTGLSFVLPAQVLFKYQLEGFDPDWIDAGQRRTAYYTNIPPGSYKFKVIACNNDGVWNTIGDSFSFYLKPHFYQTKVFYLLLGFLIVVLGFTTYRMRINHLKKGEKRLQRIVNESTTELQEKNSRLEIEISERKKTEKEKEKLITDLSEAFANIKNLKGLLPICASCKKIRDDKGYWNQIEVYIMQHSEADFSHSLCPECAKKIYPEMNLDKK